MVRKTAVFLIGALVLPATVFSSPAEARYWRGGFWGPASPRRWSRERSSEVWQPRHMHMAPDIMAPGLMDITAALMDTIPALTTLIKPIPTAPTGKLIDAITRLMVVIATAPGKKPQKVARADLRNGAMSRPAGTQLRHLNAGELRTARSLSRKRCQSSEGEHLCTHLAKALVVSVR